MSRSIRPVKLPSGHTSIYSRACSLFLCLGAGMFTATEVFAWCMDWAGWLGPNAGGLYLPWRIIGWAWTSWSRFPEHFRLACSAGTGVSALLLYSAYRALIGPRESILHGSARWADREDIRKAGMFAENGVYVGGWEDEGGRLHYLRHNGSEHILCIAPTRSGKGICLVIPTLLGITNSCLITDLKGELWALTSGWRKHHAGNIVLRFEPASSEGSVCWNPMDEIRIGTEYEVSDVQNLATMIVDPEGKGLKDHWTKTSQSLLVGCMLYLLYLRKDAMAEGLSFDASLPAVDALLSDPTRASDQLWDEMIAYRTRVPVHVPEIRQCGQRLSGMDEKSRTKLLEGFAGMITGYLSSKMSNDTMSRCNFSLPIQSTDYIPLAEHILGHGGAPYSRDDAELLTGIILYRLHRKAGGFTDTATLGDVRDELLTPEGRKSLEQMKEFRYEVERLHDTIAMSGQDMKDRPEQERGSVLSTAKSFLALYRDTVVARNVRTSGFRIKDLVNIEKPVSLYIVTQPADKARLRPLTRILINMVCRVLAEKMEFTPTEGGGRRARSNHKHKLLMMLDEFPSLGKLEIIQESLAFLAGYGIRMYIICQDIAQLKSEDIGYGKDEAISSNCHIILAFQPNKLETGKYLSEQTGTTTVVNRKVSYSVKPFGFGADSASKSEDEVSRPLLTPDECMRMPGPEKNGELVVKGGKMLIFAAGMPAIYGQQMPYFLDPVFNARTSVDPPEVSDVITENMRSNTK